MILGRITGEPGTAAECLIFVAKLAGGGLGRLKATDHRPARSRPFLPTQNAKFESRPIGVIMSCSCI